MSKEYLNVFLSYGSEDEIAVRNIYQRLREEGIHSWFDRENLLPGQDWDFEIKKAAKSSDAILVCLSSQSVRKEGYIQKEVKYALDIAEEKPEGTVFIIPVKLDACELPLRLQAWQWVDWPESAACDKIVRALRARAEELDIDHLPGSGPLVRTISPSNESKTRIIYKGADIRELNQKYQEGLVALSDATFHSPEKVVAVTDEALSETLSPYQSDLRRQEVKERLLTLIGIRLPYREWQEVNTKNHCFRNELEYSPAPEPIERTPVRSSNVSSIGYDQKSEVLEVEFHNGSIYHYFGVPDYLFSELMSASSHGKYLNAYIKAEYAYEQL